MKGRCLGFLTGMAVCWGLIFSIQNTPDHKLLFEKAKFAMETKGDLQGAIKLFQEIVAKYPQEKEYAAKAQLYIGLCYEKLGNSEAVKAYELVLKNFADRPEEVAVARERLAALRRQEGTAFIREDLPKTEIDFDPYELSPDGTKIAGISSEIGVNIAVLDTVTGVTRLLTHFDFSPDSFSADSPGWSPDGHEIVYSRDSKKRPDELWAVGLDGKDRFLFRGNSGEDIWPGQWLHDGSGIIIVRSDSAKKPTLGLVKLADGAFKALMPMGICGSSFVSPDDRYLAYSLWSDRGNIYIYDLKRGQSRILIDDPAQDTSPRWSPDGKHLVFLSNRHGLWALWGIEMNDGQAVGEPFMIKEAAAGSLLNWAPAGLACYERLEFSDVVVQEYRPQSEEVVGKPQILSSSLQGSSFGPRWSPNGKQISYFSRTNDDPPQLKIFVAPSDGGDGRGFSVPMKNELRSMLPFAYDLSWLADGSGIWFAGAAEEANKGYQQRLFTLKLATGEWTSRTLPKGMSYWSEMPLLLSRGGNSLVSAFGTSSGRDAGILELNLESGEEKYLYRYKNSHDVLISRLCFSKDFSSLAFMEDEYEGGVKTGHNTIRILDLETGKVHTAYSGPEGILEPVWSPDSREIMLEYFEPPGWCRDFAIIPSAGGPLRKIKIDWSWPRGLDLHSRIVKHDWSPDGKQIAFTVYSIKEEMFLLKNIIPKDRRSREWTILGVCLGYIGAK